MLHLQSISRICGLYSFLLPLHTVQDPHKRPAPPFTGVAAPETGVLVPEARLGGGTSLQASALSGWVCMVSKSVLKYFRQLALEGTKCPE